MIIISYCARFDSYIGTGAGAIRRLWCIMSAKGTSSAEGGTGQNKVPVWNGKPETFHHFTQEIKWYLAGTKSSERAYAAARLVRRLLESEYPALRSLMYRLDPSDFESEESIPELIRFLEASPMNKQPIPDAGAKLTAYYRKLNRRSGETIPQFLIREETLYDEMWRSLQRLLKEKELDFTKYDVTMEELKVFCGIDPEASMFVGDPEEEGRTATPNTSERADDEELLEGSSERSGAARMGRRKGLKPVDLLQRLMQKGLIPLAALDIIRGWTVLEIAAESDVEKALVKASAHNKLTYQDIRAALLAMHEDRRFNMGSQGGKSGRGGKGKYPVMWTQEAQNFDNYMSEHNSGNEWEESYPAWYEAEAYWTSPDEGGYDEAGWDDGWPQHAYMTEEPRSRAPRMHHQSLIKNPKKQPW